MAENVPVVRYEVVDRVATVTLNRPEARNALSRALTYALWDAVGAAGADPDVDAVIITGAGQAFCAGVDLKELSGEAPPSTGPRPSGKGPERGDNGLFRFVPVIPKPVIGAINGVAVTGGLEIALQCTFLVASERARFADTHARVGIMPGGGITVLLAQSIGLRRAIELSLTGNFLSADEALRLGLVNHVVPHDDLLPFARKLAADIVSNDQRGVRRLLAHYRALADTATLTEAHLLEGVLAETWTRDGRDTAARRAAVTARGRAQTSPDARP
ncbi:enoyl-CoA hydratase [Frankia sp. CNm7]|uniref:Enoyl-CoA hydratase n=1 Tax=Frankia nepalensis TaxID=1836974 RepID=A0A937RGN0_9ACTN|nr:enoyl-CoA hydratase [Frankia nepalensis]MBL7499492.1 enoyl-CoA hydratase [Frankia nepalensis]MBL7515805.1 enoyl-CoA hydratase [Frankia nepalensis]MBL7522327.1 enoyl-CoA hydratase [Frankia nepalensis]MBL7631866.1 enoyl-CoA hydratase [Frankia nepalensis]